MTSNTDLRGVDRIAMRFAKLAKEGRSALVSFTTAGDPDLATCGQLLAGLPAAGVDIIELGIPFSDPMADGPAIQAANLRAFKAGITVPKVLELVREFRTRDAETPLVLMGYYNPIYAYGGEKFLRDAKAAGVDGLIVVDLPPEEDSELCLPAINAGLHFIRLVTPTTDAKRLPTVLNHAGGFLYYVSVAGITGKQKADAETLRQIIPALRQQTPLPVVVGFGITTPEQVRAIGACASGVVVGSAIVNRIASNLDGDGKAKDGLVADVLNFVRTLAGQGC